MKKALSLTLTGLTLLAGLAATGCGSDSNVVTGSSQQQLREFVVIPNSISPGILTVKGVNLVNGTQSLISNTVPSGGDFPSNVKFCPGRPLFFVANQATVCAFSIDANGGVALLDSQAAPAGSQFLAVHPSGQYVYVGGGTSLRTFAVQQGGGLVQMGADVTLAGFPGFEGGFSNGGSTLHVGEVGRIESFPINNAGALGTPVATALGNGADRVLDLSVSPAQDVLEAVVQVNGANDEVRGFPLTAGALGAPSIFGLGGEATSCDFARNSQFFVGMTGTQVRGFTVAASGALTEFANSPATNTNNGSISALDPTNQFLFSVGNSIIDVRARLADGTFANTVTSDSAGLNNPFFFDFFQFTYNQ